MQVYWVVLAKSLFFFYFLQIYNEMIRDLLNPSAGILDLREDAKGGVQVAGLSEVTARSTDEVSLEDDPE